MIQIDLRISLESSALSLGGHSAPLLGGDRATAFGPDGRPLIPASALRGALRVELERLLRAVGESVCGPAEVRGTGGVSAPCGCAACSLFGRRDGLRGALRLEDAVLEEAIDLPEERQLRSRVAIDRRSGGAAEGLLAFLETHAVPEGALTFHARGHLVPLPPATDVQADLKWLEAAARAVSAIGGGRGAGFGWASVKVVPRAPAPEAEGTPGAAAAAGQNLGLWLEFEALGPLHLGRGRSLAGYAQTLGHAPGSTVRGALAFALLEHGLAKPDDPALSRLFMPDAQRGRGEVRAPTFGSARADGDRPLVSARVCRGHAAHRSDRFLEEFLRGQACREGIGLELAGGCWDRDCAARRTDPWRPAGPPRGVRTRTALDRRTGGAADALLHSIEVLAPGRGGARIALRSQVRGLTGEDASRLRRLDGRTVWLGGRRSNGLGACRLHVRDAEAQETRPRPEWIRREMKDLRRHACEAWQSIARSATRPDLAQQLDIEQVRIVLDEPWHPGEAATPAALRAGPLAGVPGLTPFGGMIEIEDAGSYVANEATRHGAPPWAGTPGEHLPRAAVAPGSTYVYRVASGPSKDAEAACLKTVADLAERGSGRAREVGGGRFRVVGAWAPL